MDLEDLKKLRTKEANGEMPPQGEVQVIARVRGPGYVPAGLNV